MTTPTQGVICPIYARLLTLQSRRNKKAALRLICKLTKNTSVQPETITTDKPAS